MKFSSKIERCGQSPIRKFQGMGDAAVARGLKIYSLNIGQPDIATPPAFFEALRNFHQPVLSYAPSNGLPVMLDAVRGYYARLGVDLERKDILITTGGSEALVMALTAILDEGDEIIVPEPFYPNYNTFTKLTGASIRPLTTSPEENYEYAIRERVEACINEHTRAMLITNPGNPTGAVITPRQLEMLLELAKEHGIFLICDEVYREFVYNGEPLQTALSYPGYEENLVVVDSVSKRFSACGARVGMLISKNARLMAHALKWCQARLSAATVDQIASAALYEVDDSYFDAVRAEYRQRRDRMLKKLRAIPGVVAAEPRGAFYVMAALPIDDADRFQTWLLTEFEDQGETLMFACGEPFYATSGKGKNEVRMAYVLKAEDLERAMDLLALAIERYNHREEK